ncbi:sigma-54-dependent Fis family transcriptional regulator [Tomitella fengzijianii]|uniref:Fis family transcriptional regulator n=1 Tax=Tomitella fengzijianii TaxID=2597660 RepID=A0A516X022_9ACTN|nr:helix-turn-helix domain-containing protein [Tomitella fengzijianii]QDQ96380.1 Fis family transcriptional regulator [Tomitella fengzijianii]
MPDRPLGGPAPGGAQDLRADIARSWQRSVMCGLEPEHAITAFTGGPGSAAVRRAAGPVLDELARHTAGTGVALLLGDRDGVIVDRWSDTGAAERALERRGVIPGMLYSEEQAGTNGLGTALELGRGVAIHGAEHFLESLKGFSCYGHPIRHPLTGRVEGVVDITGVQATANPLYLPLVVRAVEEIERRLVEGARVEDLRLMSAYQQARRRSRSDAAVVGLGDELALADPAALDLVDPRDHPMLRGLARGLVAGRPSTTDAVLVSGVPVRVAMTRVEGAGAGTVFRIEAVAGALRPGTVPAAGGPEAGRSGSGHAEAGPGSVAVVGEPGSGVTTAALRLIDGADGAGETVAADVPRLTLLDAVEVDTLEADTLEAGADGERVWGRRFADALRDAERDDGAVVLVEHADLLPDPLLRRVSRALAGGAGRACLVVTVRTGTGAGEALAALCERRVAVPPLRERQSEFPRIVAGVLAELVPDGGARVPPGVATVLASYPWPGNITELRAVLAAAVCRSGGTVTVDDLPEHVRRGATAARLTGMERAERAAIVAALAAKGGNKRQAAEELGISRTTLYARMRTLKV